ncbi:MAG: hypothetical protein IIA89_15250 [Chloroflexi bacterium]|nr:hypothetical protein [Chloroflexota bacterium]
MMMRDREEGLPQTPVAVLGTLAEFHLEPIPYDLAALVRLVSDLRPDFLCLDMMPEQWRQGDFEDLPPEYREALLPLAHQTDIVVVPIAGDRPPREPSAPGWRGWTIATLRRYLATLQRNAPGPAAMNEGLRHFVADLLYGLMSLLAGGGTSHEWRQHTVHLVREVLDVARRDPGRRVLVAVNVRYCHHIRHALSRYPELRLVRYSQL